MISSVQPLHRGGAAAVMVPAPARARHLGAAGSIVTGARTRVPKGCVLYREGDLLAAPYLVVSGVFRVVVRAATGKERLADLAGPGDVLATAVFDAGESTETVVAASDAVVVTIDVQRTLARPSGRRDLAAALVKQLNRSREMADDLGLPMGARICRILARVAERLGDRIDHVPATGPQLVWRHLPFSLTHDDVALMAGCARVTATRVLGELKDAGVLHGHRGDYSVVPTALEAAADHYVYEVL